MAKRYNLESKRGQSSRDEESFGGRWAGVGTHDHRRQNLGKRVNVEIRE